MMSNTSSCTRHPTIAFPAVSASAPSERDYNSSTFHGNLYSNDGCSVNDDMYPLDELFLQDLCNNCNFDISSDDSECLKTKSKQSDVFDLMQVDDNQLRGGAASSQTDQPSLERTDKNLVVDDCRFSADVLSNDGGDTKHESESGPGLCKKLIEESTIPLGKSDLEKRKSQAKSFVSRAKGRPIKSAQNSSATGNCKPLIQCFTCNKTFNNSSALAKHKLIHSDDRKYSCAICSKSFKRQDHLHGHMMTHSAKKPYECCFASCDKSYCDARSLKRHHENHHFQLMESSHREFSLSSGDIKNFDPSALKDLNHWTTGFNPLDEPKPVKCSVCGKRFRNLPALNGHMRLHGGYMRQVKPEISEARDLDKDAISESLETSCGSLSSEDTCDLSGSKKDIFKGVDSSFISKTTSIKRELLNDQYWGNSSQKWCKGNLDYPGNIQNSGCENEANIACFYSSGQSSFKNEINSSSLVQVDVTSVTPHPSLSSPCLAVSPPTTPGQQKQFHSNKNKNNNNSSYDNKYFRRAATPMGHPNILNVYGSVKSQRSQNLHSANTNLHKNTSSVFANSPFASNNYTPVSATTPNFFQFPSSYEDVSVMSSLTSQNHSHLMYTNQFPSTSPFLNIQSRPRTPFTPNTPSRSCRQQQFYYNHGDESPLTPNLRGYCHKTPTYHPYHSNYRYYSQLKHHNSNQNFSSSDSDFNKCIEMLEKGNIENLVINHSDSTIKQRDNLMNFTHCKNLASEVDVNLIEEAAYSSSLDQNSSSNKYWTNIQKPSGSTNSVPMVEQAKDHEIQDSIFQSNFTFGSDEIKPCSSFNNLNQEINNTNLGRSYNETLSSNHHFTLSTYDFISNATERQESSFKNEFQSDDHHLVNSLSMDPSDQRGEKKKKKHKPEPLWIPADVNNFTNTGGCFVDQSTESYLPSSINCCRKKVLPPSYMCATQISTTSCHVNLLPPNFHGDKNNQILPNSAPPFQDFSLEPDHPVSSSLNGF